MSETTLKRYFSDQVESNPTSTSYTLLWRQQQLIVCQTPQNKVVSLAKLKNQQSLVECLRRSTVKLVKLDLKCDETTLNLWVDACFQAEKPVYLRLPSSSNFPSRRYPLYWRMKRGIDLLGAALLLITFSPLMALLAWLIHSSSPGPIFVRHWRVGERGKLFQMISFRITTAPTGVVAEQKVQQRPRQYSRNSNLTPLGSWMYPYYLDKLPQLFNVIHGEMSLIGPHPWELNHAINIPQDLRHRLNALPGVAGARLSRTRSQLLDLREVNLNDLKYLRDWSLITDARYLLSTLPQILLDFVGR